MCFIKPRSVDGHFFLLTMEFYEKQSVCKSHLFSPSCFTDGHEAESTFGMVKRRFAPWRLYSSAECTSLHLMIFQQCFRNCIFQNLTYLEHHKKNMTMSSFCNPKVVKSAAKILKIGSLMI